jgi:Transposase protein
LWLISLLIILVCCLAHYDVPCSNESLDIETCQAEPSSSVSSDLLHPMPAMKTNSYLDNRLKKALKRKLKVERTRCSRLRRRLLSRPRPTKKQGSSIAGLGEIKACLTPAAFTLLKAQVRLHNKRARKWTNAERTVSLALHYQSPKTYRFLKHVFRLPSAASLHRWVQRIKIEPGMNKHTIDLLTLKVKNLSDRDRYCVLMLDEMAVKKGLRYCKMRDIVIGFDDDGTNRTSVLCSSVLVFMVRGMFSNWKQCVCFAFTSSSLQADHVKAILFDVLKQLASLKLNVRLIVSDQGSVFQKMFNGLEVSESKPWLDFENQVICVMPDPPHLLKNVRNALYRYDIHHQGGVARWSDNYACGTGFTEKISVNP